MRSNSAITSSFDSARRSISGSRQAARSQSQATTVAARLPSPVGVVSDTTRSCSLRRMSSSSASPRAPRRSILLTKISSGSPAARMARARRRVCGCTPSTAETTSTTPSSTRSDRSTSATKSAWPGVSIRLTLRVCSWNETTADLIVMPRARSSSRVSVWVVPLSTLPTEGMTPAVKRMRSVRLVLPASTCARIPMLTIAMRATPIVDDEEPSVGCILHLSPHGSLLVPCALVPRSAGSHSSSGIDDGANAAPRFATAAFRCC